MKLFVRAAVFPSDGYTSYWSVVNHEWGSLGQASVFTEDEIKTFKLNPAVRGGPVAGGFITLANGAKVYVPMFPTTVEWVQIPDVLKQKSIDELQAEWASDGESLEAQEIALKDLLRNTKERLKTVEQKLRVKEAIETAEHRLKPEDADYLTHMSHCYPKEGVDGHPAGCKYGEDDECPAAMFEDPWAEYLRITESA